MLTKETRKEKTSEDVSSVMESEIRFSKAGASPSVVKVTKTRGVPRSFLMMPTRASSGQSKLCTQNMNTQ